jgi:hypothetical protein
MMKKNHMLEYKHLNDNEIIDKYLLHQLTEEEENLVEEHLLFCEECQQILENRKGTINAIRHSISGTNQTKNEYLFEKNANQSIKIWIVFKVAATIIIILSLTFLIRYLYFNEPINQKPDKITKIKDTSKVLKHNEINKNQVHKNDGNKILTESFKELPEYEKFIKNPLRSDNLEVFSPGIGQVFQVDKEIEVRWESESINKLHIAIFNNHADVVFEKQITKDIKIKPLLIPGLYYWQLETNDEALFTGKFLIEK